MNTTLPNLSTWHRTPIGATIPAGTPYAYVYEGGITVRLDGHFLDIAELDGGRPYYTEHPVAPPLPTEEGATIVASHVPGGSNPPHTLLTREDGCWVNCYGDEWAVKDIRTWAPVAIGETVVVRP